MASSKPERLWRETPPESFMPRASRESPAVLNIVIPARTRHFLNVTYDPCFGAPGVPARLNFVLDGRDARRSIFQLRMKRRAARPRVPTLISSGFGWLRG